MKNSALEKQIEKRKRRKRKKRKKKIRTPPKDLCCYCCFHLSPLFLCYIYTYPHPYISLLYHFYQLTHIFLIL